MSCSLTCIAVLASRFVISVPVDGIEARQSNPVAPRGGVMMVQLFSQDQGDNWPSTLEVTFEDGRVKTGLVGWIEIKSNDAQWTSNPSRIRPVQPKDSTLSIDPKDAISGPVLLVELPLRGDGLVRVGGDTIDPRWTDLPLSLPNFNIIPVNDATRLTLKTRDDLPEWNPFEYWRWTLVASRRGVMPPRPPSDTPVEKLAALQGAHLWRIGFHRLERSSRGVAAACRDLLTDVAEDGSHPYACWVVEPSSLQQLLSILLDGDTSSNQLAKSALRWVEDQRPHIHWLEQVYGSQVTLSIANPTVEPAVAMMRWENVVDIPIAIEVPALQTVRSEVERIPPVDTSIFGPSTSDSQMQWLSISIENHVTTMPIVPSEAVARPPSVLMQTLHPLWTLQSVQSGRPNSIHPAYKTTVEVRKLLGAWELYLQCNGGSSSEPLPSDLSTPAELRGVEAITVLHPESNSMVSIATNGEVVGVNTEEVEVYTSINETGWVARVVVPTAWLNDDHLSFSVVRTHGDSMHVETGPLPCVPWSINPKPIHIDLSAWDTVDTFPISLPMK